MSEDGLAPWDRSARHMTVRHREQDCDMPRLYSYAGPAEIRLRCVDRPLGTKIADATDLAAWLGHAEPSPDGRIAATFVIDAAGNLLLADHRSEHVACAGGSPVGRRDFLPRPGRRSRGV
jgi:hypothetical protein